MGTPAQADRTTAIGSDHPSLCCITGHHAGHWFSKAGEVADEVESLRVAAQALAAGLVVLDKTHELGSLVGSADMARHPVHRWFSYKEGFSPLLPPLLAKRLGVGETRRVVDSFAGVGTTVTALSAVDEVEHALGVEYSPLAHLVGAAKVSAATLDASRLKDLIDAVDHRISGMRRHVAPPSLSSFRKTDIFEPEKLQQLLRAREAIRESSDVSAEERAFLLVGLAAIVEDVSGVMKDGRALRIRRGRKRYSKALRPQLEAVPSKTVRSMLKNQWMAMIEDVVEASQWPISGKSEIVRGDARDLELLIQTASATADARDSVGLHLYSPPYLNCVDYSEVYKLELWLLELVKTSDDFRRLREGTLRSHPSVKFPERAPEWGGAEVFNFIDQLTLFLEARLPRARVGTMVGEYFRDMYEVLIAQVRTLEPGGHIACVVANSTFTSRLKEGGAYGESWRVPVLTDVLIARLAQQAGADPVAIWESRHLRPRNARAGHARESVVVCRRPRR